MKTADCDILIVPGVGNSGPDHWQSRWERKLPTARRVVQRDWNTPDRGTWAARLLDVVEAATRPVVLIAHAFGVVTIAHAAPELAGRVHGAFLVAPTSNDWGGETVLDDLAPDLPREPLPFPSLLVASRTDPWCSFEAADEMAAAWGSLLVDAGDAGHIDAASGHGPWPEGLTRFAMLMKRI